MRLRAPADRNASLLGVALLGAALAARGLRFEPGALQYPDRGKPRLAAGPEFSIAHAAGCVGCALAVTGRIGFDLEARATVAPEALRLALGAGELAQLRAGLDATVAWVMAEAVLKAAGRGIAAAARVRLQGPAASLDGERFGLVPVVLGAARVAYVAHEGAAARVVARQHEAREFAPLP